MEPSLATADPAHALGVAVSVYSSRETWDVLERTLHCALQAVAPLGGVVDVVINGNDALAQRAAAGVRARSGSFPQGTHCRVWTVALGDKAHAWNQYLHHIAGPAALYVFVDGYARLATSALNDLVRELQGRPEALACIGLPTSGWNAPALAARLRAEGGLHGNLYALTPAAVRQLHALGYRLPLGIYRTDSTLGAALAFGLGLFPREWLPRRRLALSEGARWEVSSLRWWHPADWRVHLKRVMRQGQGSLENAAVKDRYAVLGQPFESLPSTVLELVQGWMQRNPEQAGQMLRRSWRARVAWKRLQAPRDWRLAAEPPRMLVDTFPERTTAVAAAG